MRRTTIIGTALTLAVAGSAYAQETGTVELQQRYQIQIFQGVLQTAVRQGGDAFVRQQAPFLPSQIQLTANDPSARGFAPPHGGGLLFTVSVPNIRVPITELFVDQLRQRQQDPRMPAGRTLPGTVRPDSVTGASGAPGVQGLAQPDPMSVSPSAAESPVLDDGRCAMRAKPTTADPTFNYWYAISVCDALMDAMLDNSNALTIKDDEWLTVAAVAEPDMPGVINSPAGYTTYLEIKGADLLAYRQGRLSKEEARKLVALKQR